MGSTPSWDALRERLAAELESLSEGEFVVVAEPEAAPGSSRGLFRRKPQTGPVRYVQFRDDGEWMYAECIGATLFGGDWEVSDDQHARLREAGWLAPGDDDPSGTQPAYPNYWALVPRADTGRLAGMGVGALAELGAAPTSLEWRRER
jgi:type III secretion system-like peptide-binding chaperone